MGVKRQLSLAYCLCKLHNYCMDTISFTDSPSHEIVILRQDGIVPDEKNVPQDLLHGGEHFEDIDNNVIGAGERSLPCSKLWHLVLLLGKRCPVENIIVRP